MQLVLMLLFCALLLVPPTVRAQDIPQLVITEVYPAPGSGQSEWIELFNPSQFGIDLTGWSLEDQLTTPSVLVTLSGQVMASELVLVSLPTAKLNNGGDGVTLKNNLSEVVDTMSFSSSQTGMSWSRLGVLPAAGWELGAPTPNELTLANLLEPDVPPTFPPLPSQSPYPTTVPSPNPSANPASPAPTPSPSPTPFVATAPQTTPAESGVILTITEIGACPESGQSEWVEVYNSSSSAIDLQGWYITDASLTTQAITGSVDAHQYQLLFWTRSLLNNSGDSIYVHDAAGTTRASASYTSCETGQTLSLIDGMWQNGVPTPGAPPLSLTNHAAIDSSPISSVNSTTGSSPVIQTTTLSTSISALDSTRQGAPTEVNSLTTLVQDLAWWPRIDLAYLTASYSAQSTARDGSDSSADTVGDAKISQPSPSSSRQSQADLPTFAAHSFLNAIIGGILMMGGSAISTAPMVRLALTSYNAT